MTKTTNKLAPVADVTRIPLRSYTDDGELVVVEGSRDLPFPIGRLFYIHGVTPGALRGDHAHINCKQMLVCVSGACEVVCDDGSEKLIYQLSSPSEGLYIPPTIWAAERFLTPDAILMVLADLPYEETDYIRDYEEFLQFRGERT